MVNGVALAGHVEIGDHAFVGGLSAIHQFVRIGPRAMIGGGSMVAQDVVPPFTMVQGDRAVPIGLNVVGLKRAGFNAEELCATLKTMYRLLYSENLTVEDAASRIEAELRGRRPARGDVRRLLRARASEECQPLSPKRLDTYFISAGEHSGDLLGADLVLALREKLPKLVALRRRRLGAMVNAGVEEIASTSSVQRHGHHRRGARKLADLRMLETRLLAWIDRWEPRFAVLIDNPGFHIRFAEQLRMRGVRVFQYVAPKLWAWGEGRAPKLRANYDLVLGILPFEEDFFQSHGINYTYVGSPLKDRIDKVIIKREALGLPLDRPVIACLPGSRPSEIRLNMPTILGVRNAVVRELPQAVFIVPVASNIDIAEVDAALSAGRGGGTLKPVRADRPTTWRWSRGKARRACASCAA